MDEQEREQSVVLGVDAGAGAMKVFGLGGGLEVVSQVSVNGGQQTVKMMGLGLRRPPMNVRTPAGSFYVGPGAHDFGRPVENLDYDRLTGAPEMVALFYASLTQYIAKEPGAITGPVSLVVGLPLEPLTGEAEAVAANVAGVRKWMMGTHIWAADEHEYQVEIAEVKCTSQPVGALFDYLLDESGRFIAGRKAAFKKEVGIISIGFNTVELLVVRDRAPVQRFTAGTTSGVRRLLEIVNRDRMWSLGELDAQLRAKKLNVTDAFPVWAREVTGAIERQWGQAWKRFEVVLAVGGGAMLMDEVLLAKFGTKVAVPDVPVMAVARGLYKLAMSQTRKK